MSRIVRVLCAVSVTVGLAIAYGPVRAQQPPRGVPIPATVLARAQSAGSALVIVNLRTGFVPEGRLDSVAATTQRASIAAVQSAVMARLAGFPTRGLRRFDFIPAFAGELSLQAIQALSTMPEVLSVEEDVLDRPTLAESVPQINVPAAWAAGYTGSGWSVAILDTGVQTNHPFLAGKTVAEACYSTAGGAGSGTSLCPGGVTSSTETGSGVNCSSASWGSGCDHGTHVAGIAAGLNYSGGPGYSGVAKDASIIPMQVFTGFPGDVGSWDSDQLSALQRVYTLATTTSTRIASVNMSLGGGQYFDQASCDADNTSRKNAIDNLRSIGIAVVISSGNNGSPNSLSAPGCISSALSVGSVNDSTAGAVDSVSYFSNSASFLSLLAPGIWISSSVPTNSFATYAGTSMAAPHVAGAWALMKQRKPTASVTEVLAAFTATGLPVTMPGGGYTKPRINVNSAINALDSSSNPQMNVDTPANGSSGAAQFTVQGWALDLAAPSGTGVDSVVAYADPGMANQVFLGQATYGSARGDVGAAFVAQFTNSGFSLAVNSLAAGTHTLAVHAHSTVSGADTVKTLTYTVQAGGPAMAVDEPGNGGTCDEPCQMSGWAFDSAAASGTGVDTVHVWAFLNGTGSGAFVGVARYGTARRDVGAIFGSRFTSSGYRLRVRGLAPGSYQLVAYAHSTATGSFNNAKGVTVTVRNAPFMSLDVPGNNSPVAHRFDVAGWTIDLAAASGPGVDAVHVYAFPAGGGPAQFVGVATYGVTRNDVGAAFGSAQFNQSGFNLTVNPATPGPNDRALPAGTYDLRVYARCTVTGTFDIVRVVRVTVP